MKKIKNWIDRKNQDRKVKAKEQAKDFALNQLLQVEFSTQDSIEIKMALDEEFKAILSRRLEKVTEEKKAIEEWLGGVSLLEN